MEFRVLKTTAKGNLLLEPEKGEKIEGIERKTLFQGKRKAAMITDTIASVSKPFYLAKPAGENRDQADRAEKLVGLTLNTEKGIKKEK